MFGRIYSAERVARALKEIPTNAYLLLHAFGRRYYYLAGIDRKRLRFEESKFRELDEAIRHWANRGN